MAEPKNPRKPRTPRPKAAPAAPAAETAIAGTRGPEGDSGRVRREIAAQFLSIGATVERAAKEAGVQPNTIYVWKREDPEFVARVDELQSWGFDRIESAIWRNLMLALDIEERVYNGEVPRDDPAWLEAKPTLDKLRDRLIGAAFTAHAQAAAGGHSAADGPGMEHERARDTPSRIIEAE